MYIKEINKDTVFLKMIDDAFLVDVIEQDGIKTIRTTRNPLKAKHFTAQEAYSLVYNDLNEDDRKRILKAHEKDDSYNTLTYHVRHSFKVIEVEDINYGYQHDVKHEQKLLSSFDMDYVFTPQQVVTASIDVEEGVTQ
jgi:hypothetical protein